MTDVRLPDGRIIANVPEGITQTELMRRVSLAEPAQDRGFLEQVVAAPVEAIVGVGQGLGRFGRGVAQTGLDIAGALGAPVEGAREFVAGQVEEGERLIEETPVITPGAGEFGRLAGEVAPLIAIPGAGVTRAGRAALGAVAGGVGAGVQQQEELLPAEEALAQRAGDVAIGGTVGAAIPVALPVLGDIAKKTFQGISKKVFGVNPEAAKDFLDAGIQSSLASISDSGAIKLLDRFVSKFPGGIGRLATNAEKTISDLGSVVNKIGGGKAATKEETGFILRQGVENYQKRFQNTSEKLYKQLDKFLPGKTRVGTPNTQIALREIADDPSITNKLGDRINRNEGVNVLQDIVGDLKEGTLPYEALKRYRTIVGEKLASGTTTDRGALKRAYGAITKDMEVAAQAQGPKAVAALERANSFYRQGSERIDEILRATSGDAEIVFDTMLRRAKGGGTRIRGVMKSLKPEEREIVRATVLNRLGLPRPGQAGADGGGFSPRVFLTEYNKLAPEAKDALFGNKAFRGDVERIARISDRLGQVDRFGNPSGTAQQIGAGALFLGGMGLNPTLAVTSVIGANASSRLLTNQSFTKWLAEASEGQAKLTPAFINKQLGKLKDIAERNPDIANDVLKYASGVGGILAAKEL